MQECCSCETQRGEDNDQPRNASTVYYSNLNGACLTGQVGVSDGPSWIAGTFVWTIHDYMGEPGKWPHISSSFGAFDLAGFPKAAVSWYRSAWLGNISTSDAGRPPLPASTSTIVHIVEAWEAPRNPAAGGKRTINVYSNAPFVSLLAPGVPPSPPTPISGFGAFATFPGVAFVPGSVLTAHALAADGVTVLATHTAASWGAPAALALSVDAPSPTTGTGRALYLDGGDVALVRATVVDAAGNTCHDAALPLTFAVTAGPGLVWGTGSGDPSDHGHPYSPSRVTYHGLARGIVRAALVGVGSDAERAQLAYVNVDAGAAGGRTAAILGGGAAPPTSLTVSVSAPGLPTSTLSIALSVDASDSVLAVAAASVGMADLGQ